MDPYLNSRRSEPVSRSSSYQHWRRGDTWTVPVYCSWRCLQHTVINLRGLWKCSGLLVLSVSSESLFGTSVTDISIQSLCWLFHAPSLLPTPVSPDRSSFSLGPVRFAPTINQSIHRRVPTFVRVVFFVRFLAQYIPILPVLTSCKISTKLLGCLDYLLQSLVEMKVHTTVALETKHWRQIRGGRKLMGYTWDVQ